MSNMRLHKVPDMRDQSQYRAAVMRYRKVREIEVMLERAVGSFNRCFETLGKRQQTKLSVELGLLRKEKRNGTE